MATQKADKPCKYATLLAQTDKEKDVAKLQFKVDTGKLALQGTILNTRQALSQAQEKLEDLKGASKLDFQGILNAQTTVEEFEDALGRLANLDAELFG